MVFPIVFYDFGGIFFSRLRQSESVGGFLCHSGYLGGFYNYDNNNDDNKNHNKINNNENNTNKTNNNDNNNWFLNSSFYKMGLLYWQYD